MKRLIAVVVAVVLALGSLPALAADGFVVTDRRTENGWVCLVCKHR